MSLLKYIFTLMVIVKDLLISRLDIEKEIKNLVKRYGAAMKIGGGGRGESTMAVPLTS